MEKKYITAELLSQNALGDRIFDMRLYAPEIAVQAKAGQFVSVYTNDPAKLLPRPISICEIEPEKGVLRLVYRVTGDGTGTEQFSFMQPGERLRLLGPLGNSFPAADAARAKQRRALVIGGGIGVFPLYELAKQLCAYGNTGQCQIILGYRSDNLYLCDEFRTLAEVAVATEDGSAGTKGNVLDVLREWEAAGNPAAADIIYACGPKPMLRAVAAYAEARGIACYVSLEERMACGIGACLACVCETRETDGHSQVHNARICKDGPVFLSKEVVL